MPFGSIVQDAVLDLIFRGIAYPYVPGDQISLHTADPAGTGAHELSGGSYVRQLGVWSPSSSGEVSLVSDVTWNGLPASTISHFGVWTRFGQFVGGGEFPTPIPVLLGESIRLFAGTSYELVDV